MTASVTATVTTTKPGAENEIEQRTRYEILCDPHVAATALDLEFTNGLVTLHGTVPNYAAKKYAEEAAHRVGGIHNVVNQLEVKIPYGQFRADKEINEAVRFLFEWNVFIPHHDILVTVVDGWVILEGQVESWVQRQEAENAIAHLAGLKGIANDLMIKNA